jgi:transcriptional regulator of nitric oxide reductase
VTGTVGRRFDVDDPWSVEALAARLAEADLRGSTVDIASALPGIYRELTDAVGPHEAPRRFDLALAEAVARTTT